MLKEVAIRKAQPAAKPYKKGAGGGLYLEVTPTGAKYWRMKYRFAGKEKRLAFGVYPEVTMAEARRRRDDARALLRDEKDPAVERDALKARNARTVTATFERIASEWLALKSPGWAEQTRRKAELVVHGYLVPELGKRDVQEIASKDVIKLLRKIDAHAPALTRKVSGAAQAIIRLAIAEGVREEGRLLDLNLRDNLPKPRKGHFAAATTANDVSAVMRAIVSIKHEVTRAALLVCAYTAQRPGDVVAMRWADVDMDGGEWIIPKTKTGQSHIVPLSKPVLALLESMKRYTATSEHVFPPLARQATPHLNRDTLSKALREAGLRGKQTPHGLRATLRTLARERLGVSADVLEAQLAHAKKGEVAAAYDRTGFVEERQRVMQAWADYLDGLGTGANVTPIKRKAG